MSIYSSNDDAGLTTVDIESVSTIESGWVNTDDLIDVNLDDEHDEDEIPEHADIETGPPSNDEVIDPDNDDEANAVKEQSKLELLNALRAYFRDIDPRLSRRARDFAFARSERAMITRAPLLISVFETNRHLGDIRADMQWAEDAAWRRENGKPYIRWEEFERKRKQKNLNRPYLTYLILISHFVMMLYTFHLSHWTPVPMKSNPTFGPSADVMLMAGGMNTLDMVENGNWYELVTATFVHAGVIHYLLNDIFIYILASTIEMNHGKTCLALVYFLPAVAASVVTALCNPGPVAIGASGALFGLMGASLADVIVNWNLMFLIFEDFPGIRKRCLQLKCAVSIFFEMVFQVGVGFIIPKINNYAHLAGLVYGFLVAYVILERLPLAFFGNEEGSCARWTNVFVRFICATVLALAIGFSSMKLSQSDGVTVPYPVLNDYMNNPFEL